MHTSNLAYLTPSSWSSLVPSTLSHQDLHLLRSSLSQEMTVAPLCSRSDPENHSWLCRFSHTSHLICQWITSIPPSKQNQTPSPSHPSRSSHPGPSHSYVIVEPRLPTPSTPTQPVCFCLFPMAAKTFLWKHVRLYHYHSSALNLPLAAQHIIPILEVRVFAMISKAFLTSPFLSLYCSPHPLCSSYTLLSLLFLRHIRCAPTLWPLHLLCPLWNALPRFLRV